MKNKFSNGSKAAVTFSSRNRKPSKGLKRLILKLSFCVKKKLLRDRVGLYGAHNDNIAVARFRG